MKNLLVHKSKELWFMENVTKISDIPNITNLDELLKYDAIIKRACKQYVSKTNYHDITHDAYIRCHRYFNNNKVLNGNYVLLILKSINLDNIKKRKLSYDDLFDVYYSVGDDQMDVITHKMKVMDDLLSLILDDDDIAFYKYVKMNSIKETAELFNMKEAAVKYRTKVIKDKINKVKKDYFKNID